ncbi:YqaJ viral recombinase family protein [Kribbella albertanoniae]|uniref:YqaJ viral recombinase domain-containing protein n=1 Tax=Kribbella albertanoniae TaxID=1266829 RepID=A0A4R4PK67_9ACTN|nr:YqaJ viral recombinase family protein [Kribbella albertanoniae]TDC22490.1 hypothetical protein E1261_30740 [Kribbella albertanoniae]
MTAYQTLPPTTPHTVAWHKQRSQGIGGSDASAILGLNPYESAYSIWQRKTGKLPPEPDGYEVNEAAYWGTKLEDILAEELENRLAIEGDTYLTLRPAAGTLQSIERPWQLANLDRLAYDYEGDRGPFEAVDPEIEPVAVAEIKTVGLRLANDWAEPDGIGKHALIQGVHYMAVTGLPVVYFGCLVGGQNFRWRALDRDERLEEHLLEREAEFWDLVQRDTPPPVDGSDATREALNKLYPEARAETTVDLGMDAAGLVAQRNKLSEELAYFETQRQAVDNALKDILGDHEVGLLHGQPAVRWTNVAGRRSINSKALRADHPDLADNYTITGKPTRRFAVV